MDLVAMLCIDSESLADPALIGLKGERLERQGWLASCTDALEARSLLSRNGQIEEVWVFSSDTVDGMNLAAALKRDGPQRHVSFHSFEGSGSMFGRCEAAGVEPVFGRTEFLRRYERRKNEALRCQLVPDIDGKPIPPFAGKAIGDASDALVSGESMDLEEPSLPGFALQPVAQHGARVQDDARKRPFMLCVASGSGGSGKSALSCVAALLLRRAGLDVLLADADLQFGDCATLLGKPDALSLSEAFAQPEKVATLACSERLPAILQAPQRLEESEVMASALPGILEEAGKGFDAIVVNTGMLWNSEQVQLAAGSDCALLLVDQRPSSVRSCARLLDFCTRAGMPLQNFSFALNFVSKQSFLSAMDVSCALKGVNVAELADGGSDVSELLGAGLPFELMGIGNEFVDSVAGLLAQMVPDADRLDLDVAARGKRRGRKRRKQG